jgi:hypothetical protein
MTKTQTPRRFYIDRDQEQDQAVVRAVAIHRASNPATHRVETPSAAPETPRARPDDAETRRRRAGMGKLVQQAIRRRVR